MVDCPKCREDISDSYQPAESDVGIMSGGWYCDACDLAVGDEDGPESHDDDVSLFGTGAVHASNRCPNCQSLLEPGYGLAGGGIGPYMYCPNEYCKKPALIKSQDSE